MPRRLAVGLRNTPPKSSGGRLKSFLMSSGLKPCEEEQFESSSISATDRQNADPFPLRKMDLSSGGSAASLVSIKSRQGVNSSTIITDLLEKVTKKLLRSLELGAHVSYIIVREFLNDVITFSNLMQTSKGRDKVFSLA